MEDNHIGKLFTELSTHSGVDGAQKKFEEAFNKVFTLAQDTTLALKSDVEITLPKENMNWARAEERTAATTATVYAYQSIRNKNGLMLTPAQEEYVEERLHATISDPSSEAVFLHPHYLRLVIVYYAKNPTSSGLAHIKHA
ncbi:hypothetical protein O181_013161 [Austropuccinia psidii MF-1]|uniref:Uncharacterized protein n=1 Tax=Austropuccinia psidii MF-1 TaxID=1389203 RepID=A0A9Q3BVW8_9BASI|nr:hypothetical protein [Austropuccinia psidii MF-1]